MAFTADFGDGRLGDVAITDGLIQNLNSYARVISINQNVIEIDNILDGEFAKFEAGEKILLHISATNGTNAEPLGNFKICTIILVNGNTLTLDKNFDADLKYFYVQAITIPQFKNLTLTNATIAPPALDVFKWRGGVVAFEVFDTFKMENSNIDLTDAGIPVAKKLTYRPLSEQEYDGETDGSRRAGEENGITAENLTLNAGDGAALIQAYNFVADSNSRIGNPKTHGRANCRGAADSAFKPSNVTNIGGSSILVVSEKCKVQSDKPSTLNTLHSTLSTILAKYRSADKAAGRGLCRCYIASKTILPADEKLYAFDVLEDLGCVQKLGVENFGAGTLTVENPTYRLNNTAQIDSVVGNSLSYSGKTLGGFAKFQQGGLILQRNDAGEIHFGRVFDCTENVILVAEVLRDVTGIISVPEFENLTLGNYTADKFFAVAVADTFTLTGELNVTGAQVLNCGNSQSFNKCGGIFILAKKIIFGENARLNCGAMLIAEELENFSAANLCGSPNFVVKSVE